MCVCVCVCVCVCIYIHKDKYIYIDIINSQQTSNSQMDKIIKVYIRFLTAVPSSIVSMISCTVLTYLSYVKKSPASSSREGRRTVLLLIFASLSQYLALVRCIISVYWMKEWMKLLCSWCINVKKKHLFKKYCSLTYKVDGSVLNKGLFPASFHPYPV